MRQAYLAAIDREHEALMREMEGRGVAVERVPWENFGDVEDVASTVRKHLRRGDWLSLAEE